MTCFDYSHHILCPMRWDNCDTLPLRRRRKDGERGYLAEEELVAPPVSVRSELWALPAILQPTIQALQLLPNHTKHLLSRDHHATPSYQMFCPFCQKSPVGFFLLSVNQASSGLDSGSAYAPVIVSGVTVPQYGVEGKHAVLYCR